MTTIQPPRVSLDDLNTIPRNGSQAEHGPWQPINLAELPDQPPVQPTLGNVGIVYPGKRHIFSGPQESAKTLAAYAIGIEIVRHGGTTLLIDFEMGAWDTRNRLRELGCTTEELERIPYLEPSEPADDTTMAQYLTLQPDLVVIDAAAGAYDLQGLDENKRGDVERFTRIYVRTFWRNGVATIVLDHVVKNTETRGKYAVGSERKVGGADVHLGFEVITPISRGGNGLYKIVTHKDRGGFLKRGTLANMRLESAPETHQITWAFEAPEAQEEGQPFRPTALMEKVSVYLELREDSTASRTQAETDITGRASFVRKAIDALISDGYAEETAGPRRARNVTITTPYRQNHPVRPTPSHPVPAGVVPPRPTPSPPYRGTVSTGDDVDGVKNGDSVPLQNDWIPAGDWIDELTPEPEPDDGENGLPL